MLRSGCWPRVSSAQTQLRLALPFPSPNINCSLAGERLSVYLVWLKSPSQGPLFCSDSTSKRSRLSSSAKQQGVYCGVPGRPGADPEGIKGVQLPVCCSWRGPQRLPGVGASRSAFWSCSCFSRSRSLPGRERQTRPE